MAAGAAASARTGSGEGAPVKRPNMRPSARSQVRSIESLEEEVNRLAEEMKAEQAAKEAAEAAKAKEAAEAAAAAAAVQEAKPEVPEDDDENIPSIVRSLRQKEKEEAARAAAPKEDPVLPTWATAAPTLDRPIWAKPADPTEDDLSDTYAPELKDTPAKTETPLKRSPIKRPNMRPAARKPDDPKNDLK